MRTDITPGLKASLRVGRLMDIGRAAPEVISLVKRKNCEKALDFARMSRDTHDGNVVLHSCPVMRHIVNLETMSAYEGTQAVHALIPRVGADGRAGLLPGYSENLAHRGFCIVPVSLDTSNEI